MAPVIRQDATELIDENLVLTGVNFDEISSLATSTDFLKFDSTKLVEDNDLDVFQHPAVVVLPVNPEPQPVSEEYAIHSDPQPASPGPEYLVLQPASPQLVAEKYLINLDTQLASPELQVMQPAIPEPSAQILTPAPVVQQALSPENYDIQVQPISPQQQNLLDINASPEPFTIKLETLSLQQGELDLLEPPASHEFTAASSVLSPSSVWEEPASPASQQVADAPKKRGRKRKYPEGMAPSRRRSTRPKVYLMDPLPDEEMEKKRRNAVNAKKHRDMQKKEKQKLSDDLSKAKTERDRLQQLVKQYKQREQQLLQMLRGRGIKLDGLHPSLEGF